MQVIISARGLTVSKTYKDAVTAKLTKLEPILPKIVEMKVVLSKEKHRRTAALTVVAKKHTLRSVETAGDLADAVEQLRASGDECLLFTNAMTDSVSVIYRRRGGGFGLIESQ